MRAIDVLKYLLAEAESKVPEGHRIVELKVPVDIVREIIDAQPEPEWIPCSERLPDELTEVNVTWENTEPEPYYDFIKGHCFTGTAVYFRGRWYWYSAVCVDYLKEYGFSPNDEMDDAIKVLAWMPLPEPYKGEKNEKCR